MDTKKPRARTRAQLMRENLELNAQLAHVYKFASDALPKAAGLMGSGVLVQLHALGGRELICPVVIRDGLSADTVEALQRDMARSYDLAVVFKPKGAK